MTLAGYPSIGSEGLYSKDGKSFDVERFGLNSLSTPLQKLSNSASSDIVNRIQSEKSSLMNEKKMKSIEEQDKLKISFTDISNTPIGDLSFKLYQTKLALDSKKPQQYNTLFNKDTNREKSNEPIYYKPPSRNKDDQYGIKGFLPPNFQQKQHEFKSKVPITMMQTPVDIKELLPEPQMIEDEDLDETDGAKGPTGEWFNPIVKEALNRQVNKEYEFKRLCRNILHFIIFKLSISFAKYLLLLYDLRQLPFQNVNGYYPPISKDQVNFGNINFYVLTTIRLIYGFLILSSLIAIFRLTKSQDQCEDLPLSEKQRALLGLISDQSKSKGSDDPDLVLKERLFQLKNKNTYKVPKYNKLNAYSMYQFTKPVPVNNKANQSLMPMRSASDLTEAEPVRTLSHHSLSFNFSNQSNLDDEELKSKFSKKFNIDFDYSDDDELIDKANILGSLSSSNSVDKGIFRRRYDF